MGVLNIRHTGLVVRNLDESLKFYLSLGFSIVSCVQEDSNFISIISAKSDVILKTVKLIAPNNDMIELLDYGDNGIPRNRSMFEFGIAHIAFTVDDVWNLHEELCLKGIKFNSKPKHSVDRKAIVVFCLSPEGTFIELVEIQK